MIKLQEMTDPASCLLRARADEMIFVLLARDAVAPEVIRVWVKLRVDRGYNTSDDPEIIEALACAETMETQRPAIGEGKKTLPCNHTWNGRRIPGSVNADVVRCSKCGASTIPVFIHPQRPATPGSDKTNEPSK
jgi:hypothetical protein